jgi:hypothetical protein
MGTASASSAFDAQLLRVLVAMVKNIILAETPGDAASDASVANAKLTTRPSQGHA